MNDVKFMCNCFGLPASWKTEEEALAHEGFSKILGTYKKLTLWRRKDGSMVGAAEVEYADVEEKKASVERSRVAKLEIDGRKVFVSWKKE